MEPYLEDHHRALIRRVRAFAEDAIVPVARDLDAESRFPWENVKAMADLGLLGVSVPERYGGQGRDVLSLLVIVEELARHDASHAITVSAHAGLGTGPILHFGSEEQKERFLPLLASGEVLAGFGLTEPGAGSDASGIRTRAVREGGEWRLDGSKVFITHGGVGEVFTVTAVTEPEAGTRGISSFIVTKPTTDVDRARDVGMGSAESLGYTPGVRAGKKEDKMGWRASDTRELVFEEARVPEENLLGEEGRGFTHFMRILDSGRIGLAALALGLAEGAVETALRFTETRTQFGRRLFDFQPIQFRLADLATEIVAARHLTYHAAWLMERGRPFTKEAAMAKLFASELGMRATREAVQVMGAAGYTDAHPVERMLRDAKICEIGEGTNEIQRIVIGRRLLSEASAHA